MTSTSIEKEFCLLEYARTLST